MIKKIIVITAILLVVSGTTSAVALAKGNRNANRTQTPVCTQLSPQVTNDAMYDAMNQYGYGKLALYVERSCYRAVYDYMNTLPEEDYQKMLDIMRQYGYSDMADWATSADDSILNPNCRTGRGAGCPYND